jgi:hypothetical protein
VSVGCKQDKKSMVNKERPLMERKRTREGALAVLNERKTRTARRTRRTSSLEKDKRTDPWSLAAFREVFGWCPSSVVSTLGNRAQGFKDTATKTVLAG